ncbi:hypothetical protein M0R04_13335 [Candidatus Dojkabacteria bacterium]|jgi:hypothetical protein|nr:hypothetical protein [Candidatus Dojkabacteria bacterium]
MKVFSKDKIIDVCSDCGHKYIGSKRWDKCGACLRNHTTISKLSQKVNDLIWGRAIEKGTGTNAITIQASFLTN